MNIENDVNQVLSLAGDLMTGFACAIFLLMLVFIPLAKLEVLMQVENRNKFAQQNLTAPDPSEMATIEIPFNENKEPVFYWRLNLDEKPKPFTSMESLFEVIKNQRPNGIRLRMDGNINHRYFTELHGYSSKMGIPLYESYKKVH